MEIEYINCNLCGKDDWKLLYKAGDKIWLIGGDFNLVRCNYCGLVYVNPRPTAQEIKQFYPDRYFSRVFGTIKFTDETRRNMERVFENRYAPFSRYKKIGKILEIGCGDGHFLRFLKDKGWQVFGVEPSTFAAKYAGDVLGLNIFTGSIDDFAYTDKSFDVICMFEVLEHLHDPYSSLVKLKSLLKDDGILVITVPNFSSFLRIFFGKSWHIIDLPRHLYHFTGRTIGDLLKKGGYKSLKLVNVSNINYANPAWGYSESIRFWLRDHNLYPSREKAIKYILSHNRDFDFILNLKPLWKIMLHKAEFLLFYPLARVMDKIGMGDNLYICAQKAT